jgi:hypothetical protein
MARMKKIRDGLGGAAVLKKMRALQSDLDVDERQAVGDEIEKVREVLRRFALALAREVRGPVTSAGAQRERYPKIGT